MTTDTLSLTDILNLPRDQLVAVPAGFVQDALALKDEIDDLRATVAAQDEKMTARMTAVESLQEQDVTEIYRGMTQDQKELARIRTFITARLGEIPAEDEDFPALIELYSRRREKEREDHIYLTDFREEVLPQIVQKLQSKPPEPQPMQKDRAEILRALLAANGGKMLAKDARKKMHLRKELFSPLLKKCDFIEVKPLYTDGRKKVIILKG